MGPQVIEVTEFNSEVRSDLRGHLEAKMTSKGMTLAVPGNLHMDMRVIEVTEFKSEVQFDL